MPPIFPRVSPNDPSSINDSILGTEHSITAPANSNSTNSQPPAAALVFIIWASLICGLCIAGVVGKCLEKLVRNKNKRKGNTIKKPQTLGNGNARRDRAWVEGFLNTPPLDTRRTAMGGSGRHDEGVEMKEKLPAYEEISVPELVHHGSGSVETLPRYQFESENQRIVR
ncbi:hypothetical protein MMC10_002903 [Thelotrema lepadinum]|nr:hypothetical protein [Thelotrema lepadinum]